MRTVLTIAGSDSSGGAGIQADLKTFAALGVYGMSVITAVTAQNTLGVTAIENISPGVVTKQLEAIFTDFKVAAVKIGMLATSEIIEVVAAGLKQWSVTEVVLDPVMIAESGSYLLEDRARGVLVEKLLPLARLITPNLFEAGNILNREVATIEEMKEAAVDIFKLVGSSVLLKGGHLTGAAVDIFYDGDELREFSAPRIKNSNTHGTGCTYSSAIASFLARGAHLSRSIEQAKEYITGAIAHGLELGQGPGPTDHFYNLARKSR